MNLSHNVSTSTAITQPLLAISRTKQHAAFSSEVQLAIEKYFLLLAVTPTVLFGTAVNVVNIIVFVKQGLTDCVNVCLFTLSVSDEASILAGAVVIGKYALDYAGFQTRIDFFSLRFVATYQSTMFYDISQTIMAFVALERCLCVSMPLKFKNIFTVNRAIVAMILMNVGIILAYTPHFLTFGLHWRWNPAQNVSMLYLWQSPSRREVNLYMNLFVYIGLCTCCQVVAAVSTYVMAFRLRQSSRFQTGTQPVTRYRAQKKEQNTENNIEGQVKNLEQKKHGANTIHIFSLSEDTKIDQAENSTKGEETTSPKDTTEPYYNKKQYNGYKKPDQTEKHGERTQQKHDNADQAQDRRTLKHRNVIKTVTALAVIAVVCNSFRLLNVYAQSAVPGYSFGRRHHNLLVTINKFVFLIQTINASANVLVYYNLNPKFRYTFRQIFCRQASR